jgi:hypothetical protein
MLSGYWYPVKSRGRLTEIRAAARKPRREEEKKPLRKNKNFNRAGLCRL